MKQLRNAAISLILLILINCNSLFSQSFGWTQKADYGGGETYDPFSFVIGNKGYIGTGRMLPGLNKNDFWEYDPLTNVWTQKANFMGTGRYGAKGFSIGNFGYAGTGWDPSQTATFYRYDPINNSWSPIANFGGSARYTATAFSINNFGYMGTGYSPCSNDFWKYDPDLNTWSQIAALPGGVRQAAVSFVIGNEAFVGTGACQSSLHQDFYKYSPSSNTWSTVAPFPGNARASAFAFSIGGNGYLGAGYNYQNNSSPYTIFTDFWEYNAGNDSWTQLPDFAGGKVYSATAFSINNKGYVGMGSDTIFNTHYLDEFWEYGPLPSSITDSDEMTVLTIFPVPANDFIEIKFNSHPSYKKVELELADVRGKIFHTEIIDSKCSSIKVNISNISEGVYVCNIRINGKLATSEKFLKMK